MQAIHPSGVCSLFVDFVFRKICECDGDSCACQHHKACVHLAGLWVHHLSVRAGKNWVAWPVGQNRSELSSVTCCSEQGS